MSKHKTNNATLRAVRTAHKTNGAPVKTQVFDEKCRKLAESFAAVIEDPECPADLYDPIMRCFDQLQDQYTSPATPEQEADVIRRDFPRICRTMVRVEKRLAAREEAQAPIAG